MWSEERDRDVVWWLVSSSNVHDVMKFREPDGADFRKAHAMIAESSCDILVCRIEVGEEPYAAAMGVEQFDDGMGIEGLVA